MNEIADSTGEGTPPFEQEFFRLLMRIYRLLHQLADQQMAEFDLSPAQLWFLKRLDEAGSPQPISYFADGVFSNRSNATQMIDRLQAEGLVARIRNPHDRRSVLVQLTESGAHRLEGGRACHERLVEAVFQPLHEEERESAIRVLQRVLQALEDMQDDSRRNADIVDCSMGNP